MVKPLLLVYYINYLKKQVFQISINGITNSINFVIIRCKNAYISFQSLRTSHRISIH